MEERVHEAWLNIEHRDVEVGFVCLFVFVGS